MFQLREERTEDGITLIEILVVIVIVGILAAIGLLALGDQRTKAFNAAAQSDMSIVKNEVLTSTVDYSDECLDASYQEGNKLYRTLDSGETAGNVITLSEGVRALLDGAHEANGVSPGHCMQSVTTAHEGGDECYLWDSLNGKVESFHKDEEEWCGNFIESGDHFPDPPVSEGLTPLQKDMLQSFFQDDDGDGFHDGDKQNGWDYSGNCHISMGCEPSADTSGPVDEPSEDGAINSLVDAQKRLAEYDNAVKGEITAVANGLNSEFNGHSFEWDEVQMLGSPEVDYSAGTVSFDYRMWLYPNKLGDHSASIPFNGDNVQSLQVQVKWDGTYTITGRSHAVNDGELSSWLDAGHSWTYNSTTGEITKDW